MNKFNVITHVLFSIACALVIQSKSWAEPTNLDLLKNQIIQYHDSGEYQKELTSAITPAIDYIIERADANAKDPHPQKLAIVLDIDETSLSNYDAIAKRDFSGNRQAIHQTWEAANAPAIEATYSLYQTALQKHIAVFFVTGRGTAFLKPTDKNLKLAGYNTWNGLYFKPDHYAEPSIVTFKTKIRKAISEQGYTIIASIGDQNSDLKGGYAEKTFKLPNPYYFVA